MITYQGVSTVYKEAYKADLDIFVE